MSDNIALALGVDKLVQLPCWIPKDLDTDEYIIQESELPEQVQQELNTIFSRVNTALDTAIKNDQIPTLILIQLLGKCGYNVGHIVHRTPNGDIKYSSRGIHAVPTKERAQVQQTVTYARSDSIKHNTVSEGSLVVQKQKNKDVSQGDLCYGNATAETARKNQRLRQLLEQMHKKAPQVVAITVEAVKGSSDNDQLTHSSSTIAASAPGVIRQASTNMLTNSAIVEVEGRVPLVSEFNFPHQGFSDRSRRFTEFLISTKFLQHVVSEVANIDSHHRSASSSARSINFNLQPDSLRATSQHSTGTASTVGFNKVGVMTGGRDWSKVRLSDSPVAQSHINTNTLTATIYEPVTTAFKALNATAGSRRSNSLASSVTSWRKPATGPNINIAPEQKERLAQMLRESVRQKAPNALYFPLAPAAATQEKAETIEGSTQTTLLPQSSPPIPPPPLSLSSTPAEGLVKANFLAGEHKSGINICASNYAHVGIASVGNDLKNCEDFQHEQVEGVVCGPVRMDWLIKFDE